MSVKQARRLRGSVTPQEVKLWARVRLWWELGFHFRRQVPRGPYVLDFACLKQRLVVEIDGGQHSRAAHLICDSARDAWLQAQGFHVLRFWNHDIDRNLDAVLETIFLALHQR